ncbi:MAG: hypothetical protein M3163_00120 [Actinomycetota bacterium]|nr:hypothetical protein [Actinomycetota bacterium]
MTAVAVLAVVLVAGPPAPAAAQAQGREPTTPELLERARNRGEIDPGTADLYLARILAGRGSSADVPARFQSNRPWDGTLPLYRLRQRVASQPDSAARSATAAALAAVTTCGDYQGSMPNETTSTHFHVSYGSIAGGLTITDYVNSLEASWSKEVTSFGWAAPPSLSSPPPAPIGTKMPVRVENLGGGLYGYTAAFGTGAGFVGDNPNTPWNEGDAYASCIVLNSDFTGFAVPAQRALDATTSHEFAHAIQFGLGVFGEVDDPMTEGAATWMEDEVFDAANDNYSYLWPDFRDSIGDYDDPDPYPFWFVLRALTERFGTGVAGGGEQVLQDYWEAISRGTAGHLNALAVGVGNKGVSLADAYHDGAIATGFMKACGGGYVLPYCFEEAAGYVANAGLPPVAGGIAAVGGSFNGAIEDDYSLAWVTLPASPDYALTLANTSSGGELRATAVCDTDAGLVRSPFPAVAGAGASTTLSSFAAGSCTRRLAVITNQRQTAADPSSSASRAFTLSTAPANAGPTSGRYTSLTPARILDTRTGTGGFSAPIGPGGTVDVQVTGQGGIPATGVSAVAMNVTVTQPTASGFLTLYPSGSPRPLAANLNFTPGLTVPNLVVVKVGAGGKVAMFNSAGSSHVIFDVAGWYSTTPAGDDGRFVSLEPARILDTRDGTGGAARLGPGASLDLQVTGRGGVPDSGAGVAVLNVAVTGTTSSSYLTVYPTGQPLPLASNLNFAGGDTVSNRVMAKLGTGGRLTIYNNAGGTDVVVDVNGWYTDGSVAGTPGAFTPLEPARILDTRDGTGGIAGLRPAGTAVDVQVTGRGGVPASGVAAVILNATVTEAAGAGFLTIFPAGTAQPWVSDLNYASGETRPNLVVVKVGAGGKVGLFTSNGTHVIFDVAGWFAA